MLRCIVPQRLIGSCMLSMGVDCTENVNGCGHVGLLLNNYSIHQNENGASVT